MTRPRRGKGHVRRIHFFLFPFFIRKEKKGKGKEQPQTDTRAVYNFSFVLKKGGKRGKEERG